VATDHCHFCMKDQKELGKSDFSKIPNGMPGIDTRLHLLWEAVREKKISMNRFVEITATAPAKIFGLYPKKGTIAVGADADLVVYDPSWKGTRSAKTHFSKSDRSIFEGFSVKGRPSHVVVNGRVQFADGKLKVERGAGRFIKRAVTPTPHGAEQPAAMRM